LSVCLGTMYNLIHHNTGQTRTVTHLTIVLNGGLIFDAEKNKGPS